jgi:hypothetical protein
MPIGAIIAKLSLGTTTSQRRGRGDRSPQQTVLWVQDQRLNSQKDLREHHTSSSAEGRAPPAGGEGAVPGLATCNSRLPDWEQGGEGGRAVEDTGNGGRKGKGDGDGGSGSHRREMQKSRRWENKEGKGVWLERTPAMATEQAPGGATCRNSQQGAAEAEAQTAAKIKTRRTGRRRRDRAERKQKTSRRSTTAGGRAGSTNAEHGRAGGA